MDKIQKINIYNTNLTTFILCKNIQEYTIMQLIWTMLIKETPGSNIN